ncbi:MAG: NUDIX domain-containing protein [Candidatus Saccharimonadales bacterium]
MTETDFYIPRAEFDAIYGRVPRLTVEVIIRTTEGVILTKRSMEPCKGQWHIPGGTVRFGESLPQAVQRVAQEELGVVVTPGRLLGYIEYPDMRAAGYKGWPVGIAFEASIVGGELRGSEQGEEVKIFSETPPNTISEQAQFLDQQVFKK